MINRIQQNEILEFIKETFISVFNITENVEGGGVTATK